MKPKYAPVSQVVDPPWVRKDEWEKAKANKTQAQLSDPSQSLQTSFLDPQSGEVKRQIPHIEAQASAPIDHPVKTIAPAPQGTNKVKEVHEMHKPVINAALEEVQRATAPGFNATPRFSPPSNGFRPNSSGGPKGFTGPRGFQREARPDPMAAARARAELESLFARESTPPAQEKGPIPLGKSPSVLIEKFTSPQGTEVEVVIKRKRIGLDGFHPDSDDTKPVSDAPIQADALVEPASRTFLVAPAPKVEQTGQSAPAEAEDPFTALALVQEGKIPPNVRAIEEHIDLKSVRARLEFMSPDQALAWLLLTPENDLRPLPLEESRVLIVGLLKKIDTQMLHTLRPVSHWIVEPSSQIKRYSDGQLRRPPTTEAMNLPGQLGVWISANRFLGAETVKRSANAQRINAVSLAGLVMACNRFEAMEWMDAERLSPIKPAAVLGCSPEQSVTGHEIGTINGYALAMLAQSTHFFNWVMQWQGVLEDTQRAKTQELSSALALAIKIWSGAHGELNQSCAEMTAIMLQMGASISEWGLQAFSHNGRKTNNPNSAALAWARLCAQTFAIDPKGRAAQRVIDSAKAMGYRLKSNAGEPQAMMPYAQFNLFEAIPVFLRNGFAVDVPDAMGETVIIRAEKSRAHRVVSMLEAFTQGTSIQQDIQISEAASALHADDSERLQTLLAEQETLKALINAMQKTSREIRDMDRFLGITEPAQKESQGA